MNLRRHHRLPTDSGVPSGPRGTQKTPKPCNQNVPLKRRRATTPKKNSIVHKRHDSSGETTGCCSPRNQYRWTGQCPGLVVVILLGREIKLGGRDLIGKIILCRVCREAKCSSVCKKVSARARSWTKRPPIPPYVWCCSSSSGKAHQRFVGPRAPAGQYGFGSESNCDQDSHFRSNDEDHRPATILRPSRDSWPFVDGAIGEHDRQQLRYKDLLRGARVVIRRKEC